MKRILLVDDDRTFRYGLSELLKKEFEVLESSGVSDALKKLETTSVDLICSDYNMRDGTGLDLLHSCKERNISVSFILMSAYDNDNLSIKAVLNEVPFCEKGTHEFVDKIRSMI